MDTKELEWIKDVIEKLQVPQTYNERQRLTRILQKVAPAMIRVIDYTAIVGFVSYIDDDTKVREGHTCNGCGHDYHYNEGGTKHYTGGTRDDPDAKTPCCVEDLFQILEEAEKEEDK